MKFVANQVYHIFNQGNNRRPIFYREANYLYFLNKMRTHLLPYVDIVAYCLMPNHFHWLVRTKPAAIAPSNGFKPIGKMDLEKMISILSGSIALRQSQMNIEELKQVNRQQNLCHEIGVCLSSYTRAINRQEKSSGSLFRKRTNAKDGSHDINAGFDLFDGVELVTNKHYQKICFEYIHQNPVRAGLVMHDVDWPFSSATNYLLDQPSDVCNISAAEELGLLEGRALDVDKQ